MSRRGVPVETAKKLRKKEREQLLEEIEQYARDFELNYWGCSQAVLDSLQRHLELGNNEVFKAASPFAGGVGKMREACGALVAGVMAIGLAYGRAKTEEGKIAREQVDFTESLIRANRFGKKFQAKFGCVRCSDVKAAVRGPDFRESYSTVAAFEEHAKCANVTGPAARMAAETILEPAELFAEEIEAHLEELRQARREQKKLASKKKG